MAFLEERICSRASTAVGLSMVSLPWSELILVVCAPPWLPSKRSAPGPIEADVGFTESIGSNSKKKEESRFNPSSVRGNAPMPKLEESTNAFESSDRVNRIESVMVPGTGCWNASVVWEIGSRIVTLFLEVMTRVPRSSETCVLTIAESEIDGTEVSVKNEASSGLSDEPRYKPGRTE